MSSRNLTDEPSQRKTDGAVAVAPKPPPDNIWDACFWAWSASDKAAVKPRGWIYGQHYLEGAVSMTVGDGGVGKSILVLTEAIAIVTGIPLLGVTPAPAKSWNGEVSPHNVFYYNAEESLAEIKRRIYAICQHYDIAFERIQYRLSVASGHDYPLVIGSTDKHGGVEFNRHNLEYLEGFDGNVMIFDPFISIHQMPENNNTMIDSVVKRLARLATTPTVKAIALVHHSRKTSGEITGADARGASASPDGVRTVRVLNRMSMAEAQRSKVDERRRYFRLTDDKANYTAMSSASTWLQHTSVTLPDNGDVVGVVVPWSECGVLDAVTPAQAKQIFDLARGNDYRVDPRADNWIGNIVADVLGLDVESEADRKSIKIILDAWYTNQMLRKVERRDRRRHLILVAEPGKSRKSL
jgi:hypothetical protein